MPLTHGLCIQPFLVNKRRSAQWIVILLPSLAAVALRLIEPDGSRVLCLHMQPDHACACMACRAFNAKKKLEPYAAAVLFSGNLNGLYIGKHTVRLLIPLNNGKTGHLPILFRNPGRPI